MVNTALPKDLESMGLSSYIQDAMQLRWAVTGKDDARMPRYVGNERASMEAAKRDPKRGWKMELDCAYCNNLIREL